MRSQDTTGPLVQALVRRDLPLLCLVVGQDRLVRACNAYTLALCGADPVGRPLADLLVEAQRPHLEALLLEGQAQRALLSFSTAERLPCTVAAAVVPCAEGFVVAGGVDGRVARQVELELTRVNQALAHTTRELQKANERLARIGEAQQSALATAARRAEDVEGWLRRVLEGAGAGLWEWVVEEGRATYSAEWLALHGFPPGCAPPRPDEVAAGLEPEARAALEEAARAVREGTAAEVRAEYRVPGPGGEPRWLLAVSRVERRGDGTPRRVTGVVVDVTERRRAAARPGPG